VGGGDSISSFLFREKQHRERGWQTFTIESTKWKTKADKHTTEKKGIKRWSPSAKVLLWEEKRGSWLRGDPCGTAKK